MFYINISIGRSAEHERCSMRQRRAEDRGRTYTTHAAQVQIASALNSFAGVHLLASGLFAGPSTASRWNNISAGVVVGILASNRLSGATPWASVFNALVGAWLIISPWVFSFVGQGWMWNSIVLGIIVLVLGAWSALAGFTSTTVPFGKE
jgi:hypothetical protein